MPGNNIGLIKYTVKRNYNFFILFYYFFYFIFFMGGGTYFLGGEIWDELRKKL